MILPNTTTSPTFAPPPPSLSNASPYWVDVSASGILLALFALSTVLVSQPASSSSLYPTRRRPPSQTFRLSPLICILDIIFTFRCFLHYLLACNHTPLDCLILISHDRYPSTDIFIENEDTILLPHLASPPPPHKEDITAATIISQDRLRQLRRNTPLRRILSLAAFLPFLKLCATTNIPFEQTIASIYLFSIILGEVLISIKLRFPSSTETKSSTASYETGLWWTAITGLFQLLHILPVAWWYYTTLVHPWMRILCSYEWLVRLTSFMIPEWIKDLWLPLMIAVITVVIIVLVYAVCIHMILVIQAIAWSAIAFWMVTMTGVGAVLYRMDPRKLWRRPGFLIMSARIGSFWVFVTAVVYYYGGFFDESSRKQTWWAGSKIG